MSDTWSISKSELEKIVDDSFELILDLNNRLHEAERTRQFALDDLNSGRYNEE